MRLSDDLREALRAALMLTVEQGDPEDEESPDERAARDAQTLAAVAWLDAPGIKVSISAEDHDNIVGALEYTANDYAERAMFEDKTTGDDADEDDREERRDYERAADSYSATAERLGALEVQAMTDDGPEPRDPGYFPPPDLTERDQADKVIGR